MQFHNGGSLLLDDSSLCPVDKKLILVPDLSSYLGDSALWPETGLQLTVAYFFL